MQVMEIFEKSAETAMEAARKISELNMRTFEKLMQQQADLFSYTMDASARSFDLMTKAKGYQDLLAGQAGLVRECGERCIEVSRSSVTFASESAAEYGALVQEGLKLAQAQATEVAGMTMKAAAL